MLADEQTSATSDNAGRLSDHGPSSVGGLQHFRLAQVMARDAYLPDLGYAPVALTANCHTSVTTVQDFGRGAPAGRETVQIARYD